MKPSCGASTVRCVPRMLAPQDLKPVLIRNASGVGTAFLLIHHSPEA